MEISSLQIFLSDCHLGTPGLPPSMIWIGFLKEFLMFLSWEILTLFAKKETIPLVQFLGCMPLPTCWQGHENARNPTIYGLLALRSIFYFLVGLLLMTIPISNLYSKHLHNLPKRDLRRKISTHMINCCKNFTHNKIKIIGPKSLSRVITSK